MPHPHLRSIALAATAVLMTGSFTVGAALAADPTPRLREANPALTRDLSGRIAKAEPTRALPAAPGQEMKGIGQDNPAAQPMLIHPTDAERKAGGALRTSGQAGGMLTPIGTLNIVRGEQPNTTLADTVAALPPASPGHGTSN
jgi:hypothetical protein